MKNRYSIATYIILGLALIGVASVALKLIIPIIVFGIIFLLYKFPPNRWRKPTFTAKGSGGRTKEKRTRNATFRVIDGNKGNADEPPKYH
ncbi:hypothetical protein ACFQ88_30035 [Paenibacillus sp. NPDC056579]|uniref:hypothetical protein n=1 Tax=unclassified Paenibacillus TaxID=185978 RepID=UPI001EF895E4|nr:hypothetical protein [Paenibacillus sp. H1-7]ULL15430.1 hypothetical protein DVH26_13865 [Paenibacillus sp. H1-7]